MDSRPLTGLILCLLATACGPEETTKETGDPSLPVETLCWDGLDDDGDGLVDCQDGDCHGQCEICGNQVNDDGDGLVDCMDPDCLAYCGEDCGNGLDDDGDGFTDCADPTCALACSETLCGNARDDDDDGLVDCADPDCDNTGFCDEDCSNGLDDDADGRVDCEDGACAYAPGCYEDCGNGLDDDGDSAQDCEDDDCWGTWSCLGENTTIQARVLDATGFMRVQISYSDEDGGWMSSGLRGQDIQGRLTIDSSAGQVGCSWGVGQVDAGWRPSLARWGFWVDSACPLQTSGFLPSEIQGWGWVQQSPASSGVRWYQGSTTRSLTWHQGGGYRFSHIAYFYWALQAGDAYSPVLGE